VLLLNSERQITGTAVQVCHRLKRNSRTTHLLHARRHMQTQSGSPRCRAVSHVRAQAGSSKQRPCKSWCEIAFVEVRALPCLIRWMDFVGMHMPTVTAPAQIIFTGGQGMSRSRIYVTSCIFDGTILHDSVFACTAGPSSSSSSLACKPFCLRSGISRMPAAATSKRNNSNGKSNRSTRQNSQQPRNQTSGPPRPSHAKSTAPANKALTPPMTVQVEAQLANLEQAANPWWSTFCGISNGVWLGQTAAFAPSTGARPHYLWIACMHCCMPYFCV